MSTEEELKEEGERVRQNGLSVNRDRKKELERYLQYGKFFDMWKHGFGVGVGLITFAGLLLLIGAIVLEPFFPNLLVLVSWLIALSYVVLFVLTVYWEYKICEEKRAELKKTEENIHYYQYDFVYEPPKPTPVFSLEGYLWSKGYDDEEVMRRSDLNIKW